jgi:hypothetical protein
VLARVRAISAASEPRTRTAKRGKRALDDDDDADGDDNDDGGAAAAAEIVDVERKLSLPQAAAVITVRDSGSLEVLAQHTATTTTTVTDTSTSAYVTAVTTSTSTATTVRQTPNRVRALGCSLDCCV